MTRVLGVVLAGGESRRFGSDKAVALIDGARLIDRVIATLAPQVDAVEVGGRENGLADRPVGGLGPLGGLNAALHYAVAAGYDVVVSVPCDAPMLSADLVARLRGAGASYAGDCPVIGWWPAVLADRLDEHLARSDDRSMRGWARIVGAVAVDLGVIDNVNTRADLDRINAGSAPPPPA